MNVVHGSRENAVSELGNAFHDPKVSFCCRTENLQGCLVSGVVRSLLLGFAACCEDGLSPSVAMPLMAKGYAP